MNPLAAILCLILASCATVPRAILPPPSVVAELDVAPVQAASKATRDAVRDVAKAGNNTRETTVLLRASIDRAEVIAEAHEELRESFAEIQNFANRLSADLKFAEEKERIALETIDSLEDEIGTLKANAKAQSVQIRQAEASEKTLRQQVEALNGSDAKRIIAKDKLHFWRWRFAPVSIGIIALLILAFIYRPRIPFIS